MKKIKVGILGATGMVGQRFLTLLKNHPWFEVKLIAASPSSAGKKYQNAMKNRWKMDEDIPESVKNLVILSVKNDLEKITNSTDLVFSALDMDKNEVKRIEEEYASHGVAVISNNSAHRWTDDVPMIIPEVNPEHVKIINDQRKARGWTTGLIAVKPNCSIQSYVIALSALWKYIPVKVDITSIQAISGAGKTFNDWPEMIDNVIPFIKDEEKKSELEPLKIWGKLAKGKIMSTNKPKIYATCIRIPVSNGHMARVAVKFKNNITREDFINAIKIYNNKFSKHRLPSSPTEIINYFADETKPQIKLDRNNGNGMGISVGRLLSRNPKEWSFVSLSHNTIRGAAGGAILLGELLYSLGYVKCQSRGS